MSQNPNNPYEPGPPNPNYPAQPNYPPAPGMGYGGAQPPATPNPAYGQYAPPPPPGGTAPDASYAPPPPAPPFPDTMYGPYDPTMLSLRQNQGYPAYPAPAPNYQQYPAPGPHPNTPPALPPLSPAKKTNARMMLLAIIALLVVSGGILGGVLYNNHLITIHNQEATATAQANATATAIQIKTHYPFSANQVLDDPLKDSSGVAKYGWAVGSECSFTNGTYQAIAPTNFIQLCAAQKTNFANFTFEIQMTIKSGPAISYGGIFFRANPNSGQLYILFIGTDGSYELDIRANSSAASTRKLSSGKVPNFVTGFLQVHTLGVVANGPQITVYVDQQALAPVNDPTYTSGQIGVIADYVDGSDTVDYSNAKVWQL